MNELLDLAIRMPEKPLKGERAYTKASKCYSLNQEELEGCLALTLLEAKVNYKTAEAIFKAFSNVLEQSQERDIMRCQEALEKGLIFNNGKIYNFLET